MIFYKIIYIILHFYNFVYLFLFFLPMHFVVMNAERNYTLKTKL